MMVAGEALMVPWMKSLGNGQQAGAFPLQEDKEGGEEDKRNLAECKALGLTGRGRSGVRGLTFRYRCQSSITTQ